MPRKDDQELLKLRQENETLRHLIKELQSQIAELTRQLDEALEGNVDLKQQLKSLQDRLDDLLFQIKNLTRQEYGPATERHNPRQGPCPETDDHDGREEPASDTSKRLKDKATKETRPRNHKKHINTQELPVQEVLHRVKPEERICPHCHIEAELLRYETTSIMERVVNSLVRLKNMQEILACPKCKRYVVT